MGLYIARVLLISIASLFFWMRGKAIYKTPVVQLVQGFVQLSDSFILRPFNAVDRSVVRI